MKRIVSILFAVFMATVMPMSVFAQEAQTDKLTVATCLAHKLGKGSKLKGGWKLARITTKCKLSYEDTDTLELVRCFLSETKKHGLQPADLYQCLEVE